jgi:hypothetical protein
MAEVITRFKLETTQYDSKLRDASKELAAFSKEAEKAGKDFGKMTQGSVEAARALGQTAGGATNAKEKVRELVNAYNTLAKAYNNLSEDQKRSDFAKAMGESLEQLKGRIRDAKGELSQMGDTGSNVGGVMGMLRDKLTFNIDALKLFNAGLAASKMALQVAGDALMSSEELVDEWGRTMEAGQSVYEGFLNAINNGDISGFLSRIDQIVQAARTAYDEMDRLGTMKTIQSPQFSKQEAENNRMRLMLMTGRYIAPAEGSGLKATMENGALLSPGQIKGLEQKLQNGMKSIVTLTQNELKQTGKAINAYYDKLAKQNGIAYKDFLKGTSSMAEYDKRVAGARKYQEWQFEHSTLDIETGRRIAPRTGNPFEQYKGWDVFRVDKMGKNSFNDLVGLIRQQQQQTSQLYSTMGQAYRTINRVEGITPKKILSGGGGGGGHTGGGANTTNQEINAVTGSIDAQAKKVADLQKAWRAAADDNARAEIKAQLDEANDVLSKMQGTTSAEGSIDWQAKKVQELQKAWRAAADDKSREEINKQIKEANEKLDEMQGKIKAPVGSLKDLKTKMAELQASRELLTSTTEIDAVDAKLKEIEAQIDKLNGKPLQLVTTESKTELEILEAKLAEVNAFIEKYGANSEEGKAARGEQKDLQNRIAGMKGEKTQMGEIQKLTGAVGGILSGVESLGIEIPKGMKEVMSGINGIISIITSINVILDFMKTIDTFSSLPLMKTGGIVHAAAGYRVPGNDFSDHTPVMVSSGELILNRAQQGNIASQLEESRQSNTTNIVGRIAGEDIILSANNYLRRTGKGELVTWKS